MNFNLSDFLKRDEFLYRDPNKGNRTIWDINGMIKNYETDEKLNSLKLSFFLNQNSKLSEISDVIEIADKVAKHIDTKEVAELIFNNNKKNTDSKTIQDIFILFMKNLGFESEKNNLFKNYKLRPDYYKKLGDNEGIILEVERGKTITNNMDIYDVWKCHICKEANHLFLFVPQSISHYSNVYESSLNRLRSFFEPSEDNFINIKSLTLFGY